MRVAGAQSDDDERRQKTIFQVYDVSPPRRRAGRAHARRPVRRLPRHRVPPGVTCRIQWHGERCVHLCCVCSLFMLYVCVFVLCLCALCTAGPPSPWACCRDTEYCTLVLCMLYCAFVCMTCTAACCFCAYVCVVHKYVCVIIVLFIRI